MSVFTWVPDYGLTKDTKAAVNKSKFGDGYVQRSTDGINSLKVGLNLNFTVRTRFEINEIDAFLKSKNGTTPFEYTTPGGQPQRWTCEEWQATYTHDGDAQLSAKFELDYSL